MSRDKTGFGKRVTELMAKNGLTVRRAAEHVGVHPSVIQSWKAGTLSTDYGALSKFASAVGCSLEYVLTGMNTTTPGVEEILADGGMLFDGYARISIQRLIPHGSIRPIKKGSGGDD